MTGIIRKKDPGEAWETVVDNAGGNVNGGWTYFSAQIPLTVANGAGGSAHFLQSPDAAVLLDYSNPLKPTVLSDGIYSIYLDVGPTGAMTAGGSYDVSLDADADGRDFECYVTAPAAVAQNLQPYVAAFLTIYLEAGMALAATVYNNDGSQTLGFQVNGTIQLIGPGS